MRKKTAVAARSGQQEKMGLFLARQAHHDLDHIRHLAVFESRAAKGDDFFPWSALCYACVEICLSPAGPIRSRMRSMKVEECRRSSSRRSITRPPRISSSQ